MSRTVKRLLSFLLVAALMTAVPLYTANADSSGLCYVATNDKIQSMAVYSGGSLYVSCDVFSYFGISSNYFPSENALQMVYGSSQLIFYLNDGTCVDGDKMPYPISATSINGAVYVPARTGRVFGLTDSFITGTGYGDIIRIKNGAQVLSDSQFLDAATNLLAARYQEYMGSTVPAGGDQSASDSEKSDTETAISNVYLSFIGMPSAETLDTLKGSSAYAAFFITAEQARENADTVRRIIGEGHTIGVLCESDPEAESRDAIDAIREAAFYVPTIMTSLSADAEDNKRFAEENGLVYYSPSFTVPEGGLTGYEVYSKLAGNASANDLCIYGGEQVSEALPSVLQYLSSNRFYASALLETSIPGGQDE